MYDYCSLKSLDLLLDFTSFKKFIVICSSIDRVVCWLLLDQQVWRYDILNISIILEIE